MRGAVRGPDELAEHVLREWCSPFSAADRIVLVQARATPLRLMLKIKHVSAWCCMHCSSSSSCLVLLLLLLRLLM